ncbi:interleukin-6 receptor subunit beta isoform X2 [Lampris incognitus]|uniref:interleukin-6 receptor subunit beta isoform X2 n=1 Tax=Lampris incognitus TaxID=2546036 RepID=UPI0024B62338|nr:interleukin-6 receptor subunit beta isoform X2 [Lampris incognitus]
MTVQIVGLWLAALASLVCSTVPPGGVNDHHVVIAPQSPVVEIGTNFSATCVLVDASGATADDLYWMSAETVVPAEFYTRLNASAINVTIAVTGETPQWLMCRCRRRMPALAAADGWKFVHGILIQKGYPPEKPTNLSCMAVQADGGVISPVLTCTWDPGTRQNMEIITNYTLFARFTHGEIRKNRIEGNNSGQVAFSIFPHHFEVDVWVEAVNQLGRVESEHLEADADRFVKTKPPPDVRVLSERRFPTSLLVNWTQPIAREYVRLVYQIRFCRNGSPVWSNVPPADTAKDIQSFRLQYLQPDALYDAQVRCKHATNGYGYWSAWSANATARTPEEKPTSKPDLWRTVAQSDASRKRRVKIICKDPVLSNGKIRSFDFWVRNTTETIAVNGSDSGDDRKIVTLHQFDLPDREAVYVEVVARNSVGKSPKAALVIPKLADELPPVEGLMWFTDAGRLWVEWRPPNLTAAGRAPPRYDVTEYVVEWVSVSKSQIDWQRELRNATRAAIRGNLEKFQRYNISVYPLYGRWAGAPSTIAAFLQQEVPLEGPSVRLHGRPAYDEALLEWNEIPEKKKRGFITGYTVYYSAGGEVHGIPVSADTHSHLLRPLSSNTKYVAWIGASTARGSVNGTGHTFSTLKYATGQIEGIVVAVCFCVIFVIVLIMSLCVYKKDFIKKNFWPKIPNPGNSSLSTWSPDFPTKADTPGESSLADVSVVEVDAFDVKPAFEDDKVSLPLKRDKYLSEEHSSGIGGSSCMSSPRQSVSDSDEGGDLADTTASTVQYSSVVASSGYKGQMPSCAVPLPAQPQQPVFARSESTQPLLESEEKPDALGHEGGRKCRRRLSGDAHVADPTDASEAVLLQFWPSEEGPQHFAQTDDHRGPDRRLCSYMPQLGGYRPQ